ncbi:hypothetical protein MYBA111488_20665 [Mycobacterium basiliense]
MSLVPIIPEQPATAATDLASIGWTILRNRRQRRLRRSAVLIGDGGNGGNGETGATARVGGAAGTNAFLSGRDGMNGMPQPPSPQGAIASASRSMSSGSRRVARFSQRRNASRHDDSTSA